ncbi:MAG TPA: ABC transporter transmembrane domain-containing protein, partial [Trichocoleus sp.]
MQYIQLLLKRSWQTIVVAVLLGLISGMCNARLIALINRAVHQPAQSQPLLPFFVLVVLTLGIGVLSQFILISLSQDAIYQLRLTLSRNILKTPLQHLEHLGDHRLLAALTDDVRVLSHTVSVFPNLCVDLATLAGCLAYLAWLSGPLFALLVTISLVALWAIQTTIRKAQALFAIAREEEDSLFSHFQAITRGTKELKLNRHRRDDFMNNTLEASIRRMRQKNSHAMKIFAVSDGLGQLSL